MSTRKTTTITTVTAATAGLLAAIALPAWAGTDTTATDTVTTDITDTTDSAAAADMDGDGVTETVTASLSGDAQTIAFDLGGARVEALAPVDPYHGVQPLRVTDVDLDGRDELVVTEYLGANTLTLGVWEYRDGALRAVTATDGTPWKLYEGGGSAARSGYTCLDDHDDRDFVVLRAEADGGTRLTYTGTRTNHTIVDGVATPGYVAEFTGVAPDSPALDVDPTLCG